MAACLLLVAACGEPAPPTSVAPAPEVDRSAGERPSATLAELAFDGGDDALAGMIARLPSGPLRAGVPDRLATVLDGLVEIPPPILSRISPSSPLRLVMARQDDEPRAALVVRLDEAVPETDREPGGPRGSERVGERAAVDDRIAVVADDPAMLEAAFGYLAYTALPRAGEDGAIVVTLPAATVATTARSALERRIEERRASVLASIAAARAAHDRPPDLGDPEVLVGALADALLARTAYLPDLGDATLTLRATSSGLALELEAPVTEESPLATALAERTRVGAALAAAAPTSAALVVATGTTSAGRTASATELSGMLASLGGERVSAAEHEGLDRASTSIASIRGDEGALALGAGDDGSAYLLGLTRTDSSLAAPMPWGRAFPWTSTLFAALFGCAPRAATATPCGEVASVTRAGDGIRADVLGRGAAALAESARAALAAGAPASSPDLARDLAAVPEDTFALVLARPLRALPLLALLGGPPRAGLPRGDGALVIALAHHEHRLAVTLRVSTSALADLQALRDLFADDEDSE